MTEGAERIVRRILADAQAEADVIESGELNKAAAILTDAGKSAAGRREQILERARKEADEQKHRHLGALQLDFRKEMLQVKQEFIERSFRESLDQLANLEEGNYLLLLRQMLLSLTESGKEVVILSAKDKGRIPAVFWDEVNKLLVEAGKEGKLSLSEETADISGGFILQAGGVEINCSLSSLLEMQRDQLEPEIAALLFRQG